jgi:hypothetical protein
MITTMTLIRIFNGSYAGDNDVNEYSDDSDEDSDYPRGASCDDDDGDRDDNVDVDIVLHGDRQRWG